MYQRNMNTSIIYRGIGDCGKDLQYDLCADCSVAILEHVQSKIQLRKNQLAQQQQVDTINPLG